MKILQIVPSISLVYGGPSRMVLGLSATLARFGEEVTIITTDSNGDTGEKPLDVPLGIPVLRDGYRIIYFRCSPFRRYKFSLPLFNWLSKNAEDHDIAHIHALFSPVSSIAATIARNRGLPYILRPLGTLDPADLQKKRRLKKIYSTLLEKPNLEGSAGVHFTSVRECRVSERFGIKTNDIVIPLGIDLKENSIDRVANDKPNILYMSRLDRKKGLELLIPALERLLESGREFNFILAGGNPQDREYENSIKARVENSILNRCSRVVGFVTGEQKENLLNSADVFVLPSYYENFGIAVGEAMAAGIPVVISEGVDIHPEVREAEAGWICECNIDSIVANLEYALKDARQRRIRGQNARNLVINKYSWETIGRQVLDTYRIYERGHSKGF